MAIEKTHSRSGYWLDREYATEECRLAQAAGTYLTNYPPPMLISSETSTHVINKPLSAAPTSMYPGSGAMPGPASQHHQQGMGGPSPTAAMVHGQQNMSHRAHVQNMGNYQTRNNPQIANMSRPPMGNIVQHGSQQGSQNYPTLQVLSSHAPHPQGYQQVYTVPQMISFQQRGVQYPTTPMQHYQHMYPNPYAAYNPPPANNPAYFHQMQPHLTSCPPAVNSMPPPAQPTQHHRREKKMLAIINPDTGKNIMEDYDDSSRDSSRPASLQTSRESSRTGSVSDPAVCSLFAAQVAAAAVAPKTETVDSEPKSIRDSQPIIMQPESLVVLETPNDSGADEIPAPIICDQFVGKEPTLELENSDISKTNRLESNVISDSIPITRESNADIGFVEPVVKESYKLMNHDSFNSLEKSPPREEYCVPSEDKIEESIVLLEISEIPDQAQHTEVTNSIIEDKVVSEPIVNSVDETANADEQIDAVTPVCPPSPTETQTGDKVTEDSAALKAEKASEDNIVDIGSS